jgi:hypothetical protein
MQALVAVEPGKHAAVAHCQLGLRVLSGEIAAINHTMI